MNPLLGLAGILGVAGVFFLFGRNIDVGLSSGEMHDIAPRFSIGSVFPKWLWRVVGCVLILAAFILVIRVLCPARLSMMWGNETSQDSKAMVCRVVGSADGIPAVGYLLNPDVDTIEDLNFRFITSQWPRSVLINGEEISAPADGMLLLVNSMTGSFRQIHLDQTVALKNFGVEALMTDEVLKAFWLSCQTASDAVSLVSSEYQAVILQRGIYKLPSSQRVSSEEVAGGVRNVGKGGVANIVEDTDKIPAIPFLEFGLVFHLQGPSSVEPLPVKVVYAYPSAGLRQPEEGSEPIYRSEYIHSYSVGDHHFVGYTLEKPWELVPGRWEIQLWHQGAKLAQQSFELYIPSEGKN